MTGEPRVSLTLGDVTDARWQAGQHRDNGTEQLHADSDSLSLEHYEFDIARSTTRNQGAHLLRRLEPCRK